MKATTEVMPGELGLGLEADTPIFRNPTILGGMFSTLAPNFGARAASRFFWRRSALECRLQPDLNFFQRTGFARELVAAK